MQCSETLDFKPIKLFSSLLCEAEFSNPRNDPHIVKTPLSVGEICKYDYISLPWLYYIIWQKRFYLVG